MTTPIAPPQPATTPAPTIVTHMEPHPFKPCDGAAEGTEQALFEITLESGLELHLCWHHATTGGFVDALTVTTYLHASKTKGSDH